MLKKVSKENFESEVLKLDKVILVDFYATWCGPCQMLGPILEEIAGEKQDFDIAKINIDENQELAIENEIEVVPTMIIYKNGQVVERVEGLLSKSQILNKMEKPHLGMIRRTVS